MTKNGEPEGTSLLNNLSIKIKYIIKSKKLFTILIGVFLIQTIWLAVNAKSLPYDEYYHFGITEIYSRQWSPIINHQDHDTSLYGDVTRSTSYLYHYLMSFPFRLARQFTSNVVALTILLRLINVGMFFTAILLFRRLLLYAKKPQYVINLAMAFFLFTPLVPTLAAHINYDNLMILTASIQLQYAYRLYKDKEATLSNIIIFVALGLFGGLVKYLYIPFVGILTVLIVLKRIKSGSSVVNNLSEYPKLALFCLATSSIILTGLTVERLGVNIVKYGSIDVACEKVHSEKFCYNFTTWRRNKDALDNKQGSADRNITEYFLLNWSWGMIRGMSSVYTNIPKNVPIESNPYGSYTERPRIFPRPYLDAALVIASIVFIIVSVRRKLLSNFDKLILGAFILYVTMVFVYNYMIYIKYAQAYAIQPRYLVFFILPVIVVIGSCAKKIIDSRERTSLHITAPLIVFVVTIIFCLTGGLMGWFIRAEDSWFWDGKPLPHRIVSR